MNLDDLNSTTDTNRKLAKLAETLNKDFNVDISIYETLDASDLVNYLTDLKQAKSKIMLESSFNDYHSNPAYTQNIMLSEALRMLLTEIHPKRKQSSNKMDETLDYKVYPATGVMVDVENADTMDACAQNTQSDVGTNEQQTGVYVAVMNPDRFLGDKEVNIMSIEPFVTSQNEVSPLSRKVSRIMVDTDEQINEDADEMTTKTEDIIKGLGGLLESSLLNENELQRAEIVFATNDLVMRLGKMIEDLSKMGTDDIMPLVDGLRENYGGAVAVKFSQDAEEKIHDATKGVDAMKDMLDRYREKFEGRISDEDAQQPIDLATMQGGDDEAMMAPELGDLSAEPDDDLSMDNPDVGLDMEDGADEPLGRALKESKVVNIAGKKIKLTLEQIEVLHKAKQLTEKINVLNTAAVIDIPSTTYLNLGGKKIRITESQLKSLLFAKSFKQRVDEKKANNVKLSEKQARMLVQAKMLTQKIGKLVK